ncbi:MAG: glycosyltransferase family 4 protein [Acidobacteria bacterium]|nr:glycosyltransferase family 4 protein [Acidobacteriota bacterium]
MRVTHLTPSGEIGGAEAVILGCIGVGDGWPGAKSSVVALGPGPFLAAAEGLGATTRIIEPPATFAAIGDSFASSGAVIRALLPALWGFPGFFRQFAGTVQALLPQVVHSHGIKTHVLGALLPRRAPVVWHLHDYLGMRSVSSVLIRLLAHRCALAIAVSESVAQDARRRLPAGFPIVVVHNSVDCDRFHPDGPTLDLDSLSGLAPAPAGTLRIGLPATFARWKGHEVFLNAIARIDRPNVRAYVIGGAVYQTRNSQWSEAELRSLVTNLGLEGCVGFTGFLPDMPAAYRALDIVVHASTRPEPFGLVIAEAMACARALVAAPTGGAAELFVHGQHALAATSGDSEALAAALSVLVDDPNERAAVGVRARARTRDFRA